MTLSPGTRLGPYEITAALGAGGMGEVYRAREPKLDREVAIKVLPADMAQDPERLARFEREARLLASLNHSNIAHVYGFEAATLSDGSTAHFLAMELVEGEDLSERLKRGAIPVDEAIAIARQIAEGLEEAHERGIIHRDLKPANVKVTPDGKVKVLDFGLAKALEGEVGASSGGSSQLSHSPTMSRHMTEAGMIMGTAAYMSPEQARGKTVDKRADIWSFGVVLFEMLTGERLFAGETISDVLASVLKTDIAFDQVPAATPFAIQGLLRRCLERNPRNRLHDIADARIVIDDVLAGRGEEKPQPRAADPALLVPRWRRTLPWAVGALGLLVGIAGLATRFTAGGGSSETAAVSRLMVPLPPDAPLYVSSYPGRALALSKDGRQIAYLTGAGYPDTRIRLRRLAESEIRPVPGTEGARGAFFSPDGEWLAYFDRSLGALKKISVDGSRGVTLARGFANAGWMLGNWCDDGRIVFDTWNGGLRMVDGNGGEVRILTEPKDEWHLDPQILPGPCRVLFYTYRAGGQTIEALDVDSGERTSILENASHGVYLTSGHLLFMRDGALFVAPFDLTHLKVIGPATPLPIDAVMDSDSLRTPAPQLAVARNGTLVYAARDQKAGRETTVVSVTIAGQVEEIGTIPFLFPRLGLSPDGKLLAATGRQSGQPKLEVLDLLRGTATARLDLGDLDIPTQPLWAPDGKSLLYATYGPSEGEIVRHIIDGDLKDQPLAKVHGTWLCPASLSSDGRFLLASRYVPETGVDIVLVDLQAPKDGPAVTPLVTSPGSDDGPVLSPDGSWFAYRSDESGATELLIEKFPERGQKTRVASSLNRLVSPPIWAPDGKEIYFMSRAQGLDGVVDVMAARVEHTPALRVSQPRRLFSGRYAAGNDTGQTFAMTPDGRRFILLQLPPGTPTDLGFASELLVVQNWLAELSGGMSETNR